MTADSCSKQFFFVNKSEASSHLSQSLASEKAAIQRHVQTGRKRSRKAASKPAKDSSLIVSETARVAAGKLKPSRTPHRDVQWLDGVRHPVQSCKDKAPQTDHGDLQGDLQGQLSPAAFPRILNRRDPFDASSVAIDNRVAGLIHYYMHFYHPSQWPNEMVLLQKGVYTFQGAVVNIMRTAITDKLAMCCLLAASACRLQFIDRLPCPLIVGTENHYMRMALQLMASFVTLADLQNPMQLRQLLYSIGFLGSAEAYRGNIAGSQAHFDAQVQILRLAGGITVISDEHLRGHLAMADLFLACVHLEPCKFEDWYDPGPSAALNLLEHELDQSCLVSNATALLQIPDHLVPKKLKGLIRDLVESHSVKRRIVTSAMSSERALQVTHWITMRNMGIRNRLLSLDLNEAICQPLRIALIMWSLLAMNLTGRAKTVKVMASKLNNALIAVPSSIWERCKEVKLWMVLVGLYCAGGESEEASCFRNEIVRLNSRIQPADRQSASVAEMVEYLETFQRGFFFDIATQHTQTRILADRLQGITSRENQVGTK